jgi:hypothetical protein
MKKIVGFVFLAALVGSSVVAWSRSTATGPLEARHATPLMAFSPEEIHKRLTAPLPVEKFHDMSVVYTDNH